MKVAVVVVVDVFFASFMFYYNTYYIKSLLHMIDGSKVQSSNHCWPSLHILKKTDSVIIKGIEPWLLLTYQPAGFFFF